MHTDGESTPGPHALAEDNGAYNYQQVARDLSMQLAQDLVDLNKIITTAESCTGGLLAAALTEIPGSSDWFQMGTIAYSNEAKQQNLDVPVDIFITEGAVSAACVQAMAEGALDRSGADIAVSVSGVAGPAGGTREKPVGTVWIGWAVRQRQIVAYVSDAVQYHFSGDRRQVREQAVLYALRGTIQRIR